jgi:hypothetical protein
MMILIAGPYRGGTNDDPILIKKNRINHLGRIRFVAIRCMVYHSLD